MKGVSATAALEGSFPPITAEIEKGRPPFNLAFHLDDIIEPNDSTVLDDEGGSGGRDGGDGTLTLRSLAVYLRCLLRSAWGRDRDNRFWEPALLTFKGLKLGWLERLILGDEDSNRNLPQMKKSHIYACKLGFPDSDHLVEWLGKKQVEPLKLEWGRFRFQRLG